MIKALSFAQEWNEIISSAELLRSTPLNPKPLPKTNPKNDLETLGLLFFIFFVVLFFFFTNGSIHSLFLFINMYIYIFVFQ